ncbi:MAG: endonuclease [Microcoleus sp. PH2017_10_PVI_O_A]|uniref:LAGLIDADG family homing endonuclease n=1 Tax=unclassified Microcoleus TaxID=2642155 RepID=UPI001DEAFEBC|nr:MULTISPECIES: LAGLIDADG family homing endonuclease [unclassified Microcoleus]TAE77505.1 MAG: endonuclease [Oscillatoriales cyanobacterium]MCC3406066.1 endonuclease [Microcoleus sp. PH2017_10_PVI_O_A]MCC3460187.1 endonuclease [Microcoleus sp. PH2017_11_PCY_U_A]MCC3478610.1 endonuclease [Microcoleus sp. PH2017_12_PCY_D_A]MCC3559494.1 endonuclease [Microcoleus sp. PH2017_27_LUM_O_A]
MYLDYRKLKSEHKEQIISAFNQGMECREIPNYLGVSERAVSRVLKEADINTKRRNRYTLNESYFDVIDSQAKAYLLGLIAADGCVTQTNYVAFESIDKQLTEMLSRELQYSGEIRIVQPQNYAPHYRINFSSEKLASSLHAYGIITGRTFSGVTYFPNSKYLASYVLGYFDGDGCAYANKGRSGGLVCIVGSFEFACELARHLGMGSVQEHQFKKVYYWRIFSRKNIQAFYDFVYQYPRLGLQRKKTKIEDILRSYKHG